ncbi:FAD:protein FMN transferase ApbE [Tatumella saanichensis]|uniref:FAD:protein FMN transferase ApbE n=1 Tax=Tatumella saanichensis TaxID=480813 RepID=UPI0004A4D58B|nr:FAD:protein FMN transferase ApbE [Tatumella saanichensis]
MNVFSGAMLLAGVLALTGCDDAPSSQEQVLSGKTMGTVWRVSVAGVPAERIPQLDNAIRQQLQQDDQELSTWKTDSALSRFNQYQGTQPWPVSEGMADIVTLALRIGQKTGGAMDITVGPLVNLWGFGPVKAPQHTPDAQAVAQAKAMTGLQHLRVIQSVSGQALQKDLPRLYVDLSTMGEGYATDHLARLMESQGVTNYLVSVGGALLSRGHNADGRSWRVAIQKPTDQQDAAQAVVDLQGHGISTSGDYRNYYELDGKRISHIIDPATGQPIQHKLASATVIATTALEADGWDTGLMVLGTEKAKALAIKQHLAVFLIIREGNKFVTWSSPLFKSFLVSQDKA